jgi:hypothetical protein
MEHHTMNRLISNYLKRTEAQAKRRTMSDAALIGWTLLGVMFVAPFAGVMWFVVSLPTTLN